MSNSLEPDQGQHLVRFDLDPHFLQWLPDDKGCQVTLLFLNTYICVTVYQSAEFNARFTAISVKKKFFLIKINSNRAEIFPLNDLLMHL